MDSPVDHSMHGTSYTPAPPAPVPQSPAPASDHAGHQLPAQENLTAANGEPVGTDQSPGSAEPPPIAHDRPADRYYGPAQMAAAEAAAMGAHGSASYTQVLFDLAEYQVRDGKDGYRWEGEAWVGDLNRAVLRSKGEGTFGEGIEHAEFQILYSRALDPWWNLQVGARQDFRPEPARTHAVVGVEGLAPYFFHVTAAAFLSHKGDVTGRVEASYDQRLTQRLILQPRVEFDLSAQDIPELKIGSGLAQAELGLRLRYEISREFAPYIGVNWTWKTGRTADYARIDGRDTIDRAAVAGVRFWF
ncbi:copper resistance protein B [Sphingopyxis sp. GW247-27LB]|uniref:copper resistance protein B n=1 Tax=Sphingopyxis sp. GW247-27LB TaxID=2012632 RepID=UPI0020D000FA|nr:copper resistance protein B [Sphingopyxis sp. GW247-27LB]